MGDVTVPVPFQLTQGTTVGLIILQSTSPLNAGAQVSGTLGTFANVPPIMATSNGSAIATNNNNNNNFTKNNNNINPPTKKYQKPIKPAPSKAVSKKASKKTSSGTTPPLKPPKKFREEDNEILRCKRRLDFAKLGLPFNRANPVAVARRNERERKRVKQINSTFLSLRDHLPNSYCPHKNPNKMSKVETLRGAIDYINSLQDIVDNYDSVHAALTSSCYSEQSGEDQLQRQQQQQQQQQQQHLQQQHEPYSLSEMSTTDVLQNVNRILSVQASNVPQTISMTSPTGSTCSSVCSSSSGATCVNGSGTTEASDYFSMPYGSNPEELVYQQHIQDAHPPLDIKEEDLLEFAKWF